MSIRDPSVASQFGALDSDAIATGLPGSAHVLRELARNTNRLAVMGCPVFHQSWDSSHDTAEANLHGALAGYLRWGKWDQLVPGPIVVPKPPNVDRVNIRVKAHIAGASTARNAYLRVDTTATTSTAPSNLSAPNVLTMPSSGNTLGTTAGVDLYGWKEYTLTDVPVRRGSRYESFDLSIQGDSVADLVSTATYGTPNSGTLDSIGITYSGPHIDGEMTDATAAWNLKTATNFLGEGGKHVLVLKDPSSGVQLTDPKPIVYPSAATGLYFEGGFSPRLGAVLGGLPADYEIRELNTFRIAAISIYAAQADAR